MAKNSKKSASSAASALSLPLDDATMTLSSGSVVFSVQNVNFRIPKALLQQHSEAFTHMLDGSKQDDEPVVLDDPLQAFRDWVAVLMTPLDSCLNPAHSSVKSLRRLLELLLLCHKYQAHRIETHVLSLALPLTQLEVLRSQLNNQLTTFRVVEIASILGQTDMAKTARTIILDALWGNETKDAFETLLFGEQINDEELIGAAYYHILVSRSKPWLVDERLTQQHRSHLEHGRARLIEAWVETFDAWGVDARKRVASRNNNYYDGYGNPHLAFLHEVWQRVAQEEHATFDIIGRLQTALTSMRSYNAAVHSEFPRQRLEKIKADLYTFFVPEVPEHVA